MGVHRCLPRILLTGFVTPCQPTPVRAPPASGDWLHEIKHDGFRLMVQRGGGRVRLFTRNAHDDWAARYPAIVAAAAALQARSFFIDGEAVVADARSVASFDRRAAARERGARDDLCARNVPPAPAKSVRGMRPAIPRARANDIDLNANYAVGACSKEHSQQSKFRWRCAGAAALCR